MAESSVSGRTTLFIVIPRQRMIFPQFQIGAWQVLNVALEAANIVLFDNIRTKGGVNLGIAGGVEHDDLLFRVRNIPDSAKRCCDTGHKLAV